MKQHGTVLLIEDVPTDLDDAGRRDADEIAVEGSMVKLAERKAVAHCSNAARVAIGHDVSRIEKLPVSEPAHSARVSIGTQDALAEGCLVESLKDDASAIAPDRFFGHCQGSGPRDVSRCVDHGDPECLLTCELFDDVQPD
jgi:hypothetical protein